MTGTAALASELAAGRSIRSSARRRAAGCFGSAGGTLTVGVPAKADAARMYGVATQIATVTGSKGARWSVKVSGGKMTARALRGVVRVVPKRGAPFKLKVGTPITIKR